MTNRSFRFDNLKVLLMLLVVFQHAFVTYVPHSLNMRAGMSFCFLGCTMPLFMLISGYFSKTEVNWRKWGSLFIVCLGFNVLGNLVAYLLGFSSSFGVFRCAPVMWYLWCLLIYRLLLPWLVKLRSGFLIVLGVSWMACLIPTHHVPLHHVVFLGRLLGFLPFFYIGYVLKTHPDIFKLRCFNVLNRGGAFIVIGVAGVALAFWGGHPQFVRRVVGHVYLGRGLRMVPECVFAQGLSMMLGFLLFRSMPNRLVWFTRYGKNTLPVYLLHIYIVFLLAALVRHYGYVQWYYKYPVMSSSVVLSMGLFSPRANRVFKMLIG